MMDNVRATDFDVIVVGGGHAGCEAASASARMGCRTLLLTISADSIARMSCNPSIGGLAKGQIAREIDALGGEMGLVTDATAIQFRMLNTSKGPAVRAPRAQCDRNLYKKEMRRRLEMISNLEIKEGSAKELLSENGAVRGVVTLADEKITASCVVVTTGTFLNGMIFVGEKHFPAGRLGEPPSIGLSESLASHGFELGRLKTGTPPRLDGDTLDYSKMQRQEGDATPRLFSFRAPATLLPQVACHITHTTERTHEVIRQNLHRSPLYGGMIKGVGPRYCPSIEDKIVRFAEKPLHQIIVEPEGLDTSLVYLGGCSSSLPEDVQEQIVHSMPGLENAVIKQYAYAIEYDYVPPYQVRATLETKRLRGLFLAGQINGTSGYEEAAGQGIVAGINAALHIRGEESFTLDRDQAYIGVLIDDLVTKSASEPYRMFTSCAEHRLLLRQDNADLRLSEFGRRFGLLSEEEYSVVERKKGEIKSAEKFLRGTFYECKALINYLRQPEMNYEKLCDLFPDAEELKISPDAADQVEIDAKYEGYIARGQAEIERVRQREHLRIPENMDYKAILSLSNEAKTKLTKIRPETLGQALRVSGITPADAAILMVALHRGANDQTIKEK